MDLKASQGNFGPVIGKLLSKGQVTEKARQGMLPAHACSETCGYANTAQVESVTTVRQTETVIEAVLAAYCCIFVLFRGL